MRTYVRDGKTTLHLCRIKRGNIVYYKLIDFSEFIKLTKKRCDVKDVLDHEDL